VQAQTTPPPLASDLTVPLFPSTANALGRQGFVRVINHSKEAGEVTIEAFDDEGGAFGPLTLAIGAGKTVHLNAGDLEEGNAAKRLTGRTGRGQGDWRLEMDSELDVEVLAYMRTSDGFLTALHDVVSTVDGRHDVGTFNPGRNQRQVSILRLVNRGNETATVGITGVDDRGQSPGTGAEVSIPAGMSRTYTAAQLEQGGAAGLEGSIGTGSGKWRLVVESERRIVAVNLLSSPTGHLTNLSTTPDNLVDGVHFVPMFPTASDPNGRQGFVRVINRSDRSGEVTITAFDDTDHQYETLSLAIDANRARHFNSDDLELGNAAKGLSGRTGAGEGDWRLELSSDLDIRVLSYTRTNDGFLTSMHDTVPRSAKRHRVATFNPASNVNQQSRLRLVNRGARAAEVSIVGFDDNGESPGTGVLLTVPGGASRTLTAQELEAGADGITGALGDGKGKWSLTVTANRLIAAMSLMSSPTGHLTNLSTAPQRGAGPVETASEAFEVDVSAVVQSKCASCHVRGGEAANTGLIFANDEDRIAKNYAVFRDFIGANGDGTSLVLGKIQGLLGHGGGVQVLPGTEAYAGFERFMDMLEAERTLNDGHALLEGVAEVDAPGLPGNLCVYGPGAFPVAVGGSGAGRAAVVAASRWESGRVVAFGHDGYLHRRALETADTGRLMTNVLRWASASGRESPRIGVVDAAELRGWLVEAGHDAVEAELTEESLGKVDVVALRLWYTSERELEALSAFVRAGGGMVAANTGWGWAQIFARMDLAVDYAGNKLLRDVGIGWGGTYLRRTSANGFAVDGLPGELIHATRALEAVTAPEISTPRLTKPEIAQAVETVTLAIRCFHPDAELFGPALQALTDKNEHWPTLEEPVGPTDAQARIAAAFFVESQRRMPAESVRAHPATADFPGPVPADAPRLTRRVTIDTTVPRWHSTGLYAAPGEVVKVTMPDQAASTGSFHIRVGAHSDEIWNRSKWRRMPVISRRFPVSKATTQVANALGGLIYIEVPAYAWLGEISVEIEGAVAAPLFVLGQTEAEAWRNEIRHAPAPWAEIATRNMVVTTDSREVRGLDDPAAVAEAWDRILELSAELAAWGPAARSGAERFVVDRQISVGYMHAGYPIMAHLDQSANLVDAAYLRTEGNWGFFHEVGHNHQNDDWTFDGTVEVTVNLFTLYVYEFLCGIPVAEHPRGSAEFQAAQMARYDFDDPDFEQWKRDPFLALVMYEQLQQAFGWDAYRRVFAEYLALSQAERPQRDEEKRDQWLERFSKTVGRNLGPFFEAWGVPTSEAARDSISGLPSWMPPDFPPAPE